MSTRAAGASCGSAASRWRCSQTHQTQPAIMNFILLLACINNITSKHKFGCCRRTNRNDYVCVLHQDPPLPILGGSPSFGRENGKGGMRKGGIGQVNRNIKQTNTSKLDFPIPPFLIPPFPISQFGELPPLDK